MLTLIKVVLKNLSLQISITEVKSSGCCFLRSQRNCVPEIAKLVPCAAVGLSNV